MRHDLKAIVGETREFRANAATIAHCKDDSKKQTILLQRICFATGSHVLANHVWVSKNETPELKQIKFSGVEVRSTAKVIAYKKKYLGDKLLAQDYCFSAIRNVSVMPK